MTIIDISPVICPATAVYPMDTPFARKVELDFARGDHLTLSSITMTLHMGAHADASNHYHKDGVGIDQRDLEPYFGPCQVVHTHAKPGVRLTKKDFKDAKPKAPRVIFRTDSFENPLKWRNDFNALSPELVHFLADHGVRLVGIDTPSVDPADSKELESHQSIFERNLCILEGLVLSHVKEGVYQLIALPLKIKDADASPVRAVLIKED